MKDSQNENTESLKSHFFTIFKILMDQFSDFIVTLTRRAEPTMTSKSAIENYCQRTSKMLLKMSDEKDSIIYQSKLLISAFQLVPAETRWFDTITEGLV